MGVQKDIKSFYIQNLGCAKNKCDGDKIEEFLLDKGLKSSGVENADLIILNTCGFIEKSREESIETFFSLYNLKKKNAKIVFAGCMAQRYYSGLKSELKEADFILGNYDIAEILKIIDEIDKGETGEAQKVFGVGDEKKSVDECYNLKHIAYSAKSAKGKSVYIKIAEGCTHRCSFCAIPLIRGTLVSLREDEIINNIKNSLNNGAVEINLVAQDLINYGKDRGGKTEIYHLLDKICSFSGDFKVRLLYIHPDFFELDLARFVRKTNGMILPYYDIPLQHVNGDILKSMGRSGNQDIYKRLFSSIREIDENAIIRSTFMLGYPLESDKSIEELKGFIAQGLLDYAGFFVFSREENTRAFALGLPKHTKKYYEKKVNELALLQEKIADKRFERFVGKIERALIEEKIDNENTYLARIWAQAGDVDGITSIQSKHKLNVGDVVDVKIKANESYDLFAEI